MVNNPLPRRCRAVGKSLGSYLFYGQRAPLEWETAGQRRVDRVWPWLQGNVKPTPIGSRCIRSCQQNIALSIRSRQLQRSAGPGSAMRRFVYAVSPSQLGDQLAGQSGAVMQPKLWLARLPKPSTVDKGPRLSPRSLRSKLHGALPALPPAPPASPARPPATDFSTDLIAAPSMQVRSNRLRAVYNRREHPGREQE